VTGHPESAVAEQNVALRTLQLPAKVHRNEVDPDLASFVLLLQAEMHFALFEDLLLRVILEGTYQFPFGKLNDVVNYQFSRFLRLCYVND
jgi:hypothetical protein